MKKIKLISVLLSTLIMLLGVCGCMENQNDKLLMENMRRYAENKYGSDFQIKKFQEAKDETYTNILTLSDGTNIFNVYQRGDSEMFDDYAKAVVNKKYADLLRRNIGDGFNVYVNLMFINGNNITLEYAKEHEISAIFNDYSLLKIVAVVVLNENIEDVSEKVFSVYQSIMVSEPKYIDFEVIQVNSMGEDLNDMLENLPAFYDNDWKKYSEVIDHLSVSDTNIASSDELLNGGK